MNNVLRILKRIRTEVYVGLLLVLLFVFLLVTVLTAPNVDLAKLSHYEKKLACVEMPVCADSDGKTYEDYRMITDETSDQYRLIQEKLKTFRILSYEAPFIIRCVTTKRKDNGSKDD